MKKKKYTVASTARKKQTSQPHRGSLNSQTRASKQFHMPTLENASHFQRYKVSHSRRAFALSKYKMTKLPASSHFVILYFGTAHCFRAYHFTISYLPDTTASNSSLANAKQCINFGENTPHSPFEIMRYASSVVNAFL